MPKENKVWVYAFNENDEFRVVESYFLKQNRITIANMCMLASTILTDHPEVTKIFAIDDSPQLCVYFWKSVKAKDHSDRYEFMDYVETTGINLYEKKTGVA